MICYCPLRHPSAFSASRQLFPGRPSRLLLILGLLCLGLLVIKGNVRAANPRRSPVVDVVERVRPAVVNIHSERTVKTPAGAEMFTTPPPNRVNGMGTGVIIDPRGYIVTNHHVVEDVNLIRVRLSDGTSHTATVVARDPEADLALLKIDAGKSLPTVPLGTARDLMVGETVIAIGNAFGYEHTVTTGVVSALKRDVTLNKDVSYKSLIQTDASINPGNSGGPLLNVNGEMVGVNVAIRAGAQGISFAIPVDTMIRVTSGMLRSRRSQTIWHGLVCRDHLVFEDSDLRQSAQKDDGDERHPLEPPPWRREVVIDRVESGSPADKAGLLAGDVMLQVADLPLHSTLDLERALVDRSGGDHLSLMIRRKNASQKTELVLQGSERGSTSPADLAWRRLGLQLKPVSAEAVVRTSPQLHGGLAVVDLTPNGPAERSGIQRGDILVGLHLWETLSLDNVAFVLNHQDLATFSPLSFYILRSGRVHHGQFQHLE
jgi:serine protease Do